MDILWWMGAANAAPIHDEILQGLHAPTAIQLFSARGHQGSILVKVPLKPPSPSASQKPPPGSGSKREHRRKRMQC